MPAALAGSLLQLKTSCVKADALALLLPEEYSLQCFQCGETEKEKEETKTCWFESSLHELDDDGCDRCVSA